MTLHMVHTIVIHTYIHYYTYIGYSIHTYIHDIHMHKHGHTYIRSTRHTVHTYMGAYDMASYGYDTSPYIPIHDIHTVTSPDRSRIHTYITSEHTYMTWRIHTVHYGYIHT